MHGGVEQHEDSKVVCKCQKVQKRPNSESRQMNTQDKLPGRPERHYSLVAREGLAGQFDRLVRPRSAPLARATGRGDDEEEE